MPKQLFLVRSLELLLEKRRRNDQLTVSTVILTAPTFMCLLPSDADPGPLAPRTFTGTLPRIVASPSLAMQRNKSHRLAPTVTPGTLSPGPAGRQLSQPPPLVGLASGGVL